MTDRQAALLNYLRTIEPELRGAKSPEQYIARVLRCIAEDGGFMVEGFALTAVEMGRRLMGAQVDDLVQRFQGFVTGLGLNRKR